MSTIARLTLEDYDAIVRAGVFDGKHKRRVEFIHGEIREMSPTGPEHDWVVSWLTRWSTDHLPSADGEVRIQSSLRFPSLESVPEPDVVWYRVGSYRNRHPEAGDVLLLIEVAESSLAYDRGEKAELYAHAGIAEYWVVNLHRECIEVHRDPQAGRYASLRTFAGDDQLAPLCRPEAKLRPGELFSTE